MKYLFEIKSKIEEKYSVIGHHDKIDEGLVYSIDGISIKVNLVFPFPHQGYTTDFICYCEEF